MDSMGGFVWCDDCEQGEQLPLLVGSRSSRRGRTWSCPHSSWSSLERGSAGAIGLTGRGGWTVWCGYMVRRSEQGEQLPLFDQGPDSLVLVHTILERGSTGARDTGDGALGDRDRLIIFLTISGDDPWV